MFVRSDYLFCPEGLNLIFLPFILEKHLMLSVDSNLFEFEQFSVFTSLLESDVTVRSGLWTLAVICVISAERCVEQPAGTYRLICSRKCLRFNVFVMSRNFFTTDMFHYRVDGLSATLLDLNHQIFD